MQIRKFWSSKWHRCLISENCNCISINLLFWMQSSSELTYMSQLACDFLKFFIRLQGLGLINVNTGSGAVTVIFVFWNSKTESFFIIRCCSTQTRQKIKVSFFEQSSTIRRPRRRPKWRNSILFLRMKKSKNAFTVKEGCFWLRFLASLKVGSDNDRFLEVRFRIVVPRKTWENKNDTKGRNSFCSLGFVFILHIRLLRFVRLVLRIENKSRKKIE